MRQTEDLLNPLTGGELTRYPLKSLMWQETVQEEPPMLPAQPRLIFISYAHVDNAATDRKHRWLTRLLEVLKPLVRQDELTTCSDQDIKIGQDWHQHIQAHLQGAKAAVLLVSPAFLASDYIANNELPVLLK